MPNFTHPPHRILQIPELLSLICRHSVPRAQTCLLRVSRTFFDSAAPVVWENVSGVHNLLVLLPGVTVTRSTEESTSLEINLVGFFNCCA